MPNPAFSYSSAHPTPVYRYLNDPQHVDAFFNLAKLRLSSFAIFAQLADQRLRDTHEGANVLAAVGQESTLYALTQQGSDCLVLSSTLVPPLQVPEDFRSRAGIMIREPMLFAAAIANVLDGCVTVVVGACTYVDRLAMEIEVPDRDFCEIANRGGLMLLVQSCSGCQDTRPCFVSISRMSVKEKFALFSD